MGAAPEGFYPFVIGKVVTEERGKTLAKMMG